MTEFLKDRHGYIIGQVDTQGGRRILKDRHGYLLGQYDPSSNLTRDRHGYLIGRGDLLPDCWTRRQRSHPDGVAACCLTNWPPAEPQSTLSQLHSGVPNGERHQMAA